MNDFARMMKLARDAHLGDVEILADASIAAAAGGTESDHGVLTRELEYKNTDDIHFGVSNNKGLPTTVPANSELILSSHPSTPFKPRAMTVSSDQAIGLYFRQIEYGPFRFIDGSVVPASAHTEVSLNQFVQWPTIQTSSDVTITMYNDTNTDKRVAIDFRGTRVRS